METLNVFISSTSLDLKPERAAVATELRKGELLVTEMENWDALPADATTVSVDAATKCDIFIGIYAFRYGFIPPGASKSVTEQEYDAARREGRRCLCYFKDEAATAPTDPALIEPETSQQLLKDFKQRIELELVRGRFGSPEELATKVASDIARLQNGYLPGYSRRDFLKRWRTRGIDMRNQLVQGALSGHVNLLRSPILNWWGSFIKDISWHDGVRGSLSFISERARELPELSDLGTRANELWTRLMPADEVALSNYHTIISDLDRTITDGDVTNTDALVRKLQRRLDNLRPDENVYDAEDRLRTAREVLRELRTIRDTVKHPSFKKCFPVIGSLGSGRTHFIASLLGSTPEPAAEAPAPGEEPWSDNFGFLVLLFNQTSTKSLDETILDGIKQACGLQFRSLDEFDRFLNGKSSNGQPSYPIRFCVAIDDIQTWLTNRKKLTDGASELSQFIESHTYLSSLFWLFTLQDTGYGLIQDFNELLKTYSYFQTQIPSDNREFRRRESRETNISHFSGWLAVDDLNRDDEFGLKLIETGLAQRGASLPPVELLRENPAVLRNLVKPFIACVLLDLHSEQTIDLQRLATLSYMSFVNEFWDKRSNKFIAEYNGLRTGFQDSSQALKLVAETLSRTGEFNPQLKDLQGLVVAAAQNEGHHSPDKMVEAALSALTNNGFLKHYFVPDPKKPDYDVEMIGFEFEPFWELELARQIRYWQSITDHDETAAKDELLNWFGVVQSDEIEEGVLEFLILLLDNDCNGDAQKRGFVGALQRLALDSPDLPQEAVWFSGVNTTLESQRMLMTLVRSGEDRFKVHRTLHSIMYFVVESLPDVIETAERFKILQPHYADIARESLSAYFLYSTRRLFAQAKDNAEVRRAMRYLSNSEQMGIVESLAALTVDVLFEKAEERFGELNDACLTSLVTTILAYLKDVAEEAKDEFERRGPVERWDRFYYREWVLRFFCSRLVREIGIEMYYLLARFHWYEPRQLNIQRPVSTEMHREANFALGDWYRIGHNDDKAEQYIQLVRDLTDKGDFREREIAFYLIRHSEATRGQKGLEVDPIFAPMLEKIFLDPKLDRTVTRFYELFRLNLAGFRKLETLREKKLSQANEHPPDRRRKSSRDNRNRR